MIYFFIITFILTKVTGWDFRCLHVGVWFEAVLLQFGYLHLRLFQKLDSWLTHISLLVQSDCPKVTNKALCIYLRCMSCMYLSQTIYFTNCTLKCTLTQSYFHKGRKKRKAKPSQIRARANTGKNLLGSSSSNSSSNSSSTQQRVKKQRGSLKSFQCNVLRFAHSFSIYLSNQLLLFLVALSVHVCMDSGNQHISVPKWNLKTCAYKVHLLLSTHLNLLELTYLCNAMLLQSHNMDILTFITVLMMFMINTHFVGLEEKGHDAMLIVTFIGMGNVQFIPQRSREWEKYEIFVFTQF